MAYLWEVNVNAQRDERQDNRKLVYTNANSYTQANIYAINSSVMGNTAKSSASAETDAKFSDEQGFTGKNAQTAIIGVGVAVAAAGLVYALVKI